MMKLMFCNVGDECVIKRIIGKDDVRAHLGNLGIVENVRVRVVSESAQNYIIAVSDSRLALDRTLASRIMVEPA